MDLNKPLLIGPNWGYQANRVFIGATLKNMNRRGGISPVRWAWIGVTVLPG